MPVFGSKLGESQFVEPFEPGKTRVPSGLGSFAVLRIGWPFALIPVDQLVSMNGVVSRCSPGFGAVYHRHCRAPVSASRESRYPGTSVTSPETPTMTWLRTTSGAMVEKYPSLTSASSTFQRTLPSLALRQTRKQSGVSKYRKSLYIP